MGIRGRYRAVPWGHVAPVLFGKGDAYLNFWALSVSSHDKGVLNSYFGMAEVLYYCTASKLDGVAVSPQAKQLTKRIHLRREEHETISLGSPMARTSAPGRRRQKIQILSVYVTSCSIKIDMARYWIKWSNILKKFSARSSDKICWTRTSTG